MTANNFEFEKALGELEKITAWFESTEVDLDQGIAKFERGMELAAQLKSHLATIENRVEKIRERFQDVKPASNAAPARELSSHMQSDEDLDPIDQTDLFGT